MRRSAISAAIVCGAMPAEQMALIFDHLFTISEIDIDGRKIAPSAYANPEGQLRIALPTPFAAGARFEARVV